LENAPTLHLENYQGPLDLLLELIRKQELNIFDIPIAQVTRQYNDALQRMEQMDVEIAGDFVLLASTLVHIKSKMLLPRDPAEAGDETEEDPRGNLVQQLLEHEKFKNAAQMLREKQMVESVSWSKPDMETFSGEQGEMAVSLWDLVKAFQFALDNPPEDTTLDISAA
jgi:segregation and condensation protein A